MTSFVVYLKPSIDLSDEAFFELCRNNHELKFERDSKGNLIIMSPTSGETGNRNFRLIGQFGNWVEKDGTGIGFDSSTGFKLPNGADRSPDLAWIKLDRWNALTPEQRKRFPPITPDFVVEIRSATDSLKALQEKMQEYIANGARLGLLLNPKGLQVEIYRPGVDAIVLNNPQTVRCDPELPGFVLSLKSIF